MLDHVGFAVADAERSRRFYERALEPLGITLIMTVTPDQTEAGGTAHGFGSDGKPYFWIGDNERVGEGTHIAFTAEEPSDRSTNSTRRRWPPVARTMARPDCGPNIIRIIMARSCSIPDGTNIEAGLPSSGVGDAHLHDRLRRRDRRASFWPRCSRPA